ncbi:MAG: hypothetical protein AB7G10_29185, partial [Reyranellaceae bacterium]
YAANKLPTEEFCRRYDALFLADDTMFEHGLYEILNDLFIDCEALTSNPRLLAERPYYHLDEKQFRKKAEQAAILLGRWRASRTADNAG